MAEDELRGEESSLLSSFSSSAAVEVERERLREWEEIMTLEKRRHQLQSATEMERYVEALQAQLKERVSKCRTRLPPLCSCGPSIWDADPQTCANNCPFYKNPKGMVCLYSMFVFVCVFTFSLPPPAYAKALTGVLSSLKI